MSKEGNAVITFFGALGATLLAAASIGVYEGWITDAEVDNIPYAELGFLAGILAIVAVVFYLRHDK